MLELPDSFASAESMQITLFLDYTSLKWLISQKVYHISRITPLGGVVGKNQLLILKERFGFNISRTLQL